MNISCKLGNGLFNYRVAAVLLYDNKVLLESDERFDFLNLPGGRVEMFETSAQALVREIHEELGEKPTIERLLWVAESMFNQQLRGDVHEVCYYYLIRLPKDSEMYQKESFELTETVGDKTKILSFTWVALEMLGAVNLKPAWLLKNRIQMLPAYPEHIVVNELGGN